MSVDTVFSTLARLDRELQDLLATESMPGNTGVLVGRWFEAVADFALSRVVCTEGGVPLSDEVLQASKAEVDSSAKHSGIIRRMRTFWHHSTILRHNTGICSYSPA